MGEVVADWGKSRSCGGGSIRRSFPGEIGINSGEIDGRRSRSCSQGLAILWHGNYSDAKRNAVSLNGYLNWRHNTTLTTTHNDSLCVFAKLFAHFQVFLCVFACLFTPQILP